MSKIKPRYIKLCCESAWSVTEEPLGGTAVQLFIFASYMFYIKLYALATWTYCYCNININPLSPMFTESSRFVLSTDTWSQ